MIKIRTLKNFNANDLRQLSRNYISTHKYVVKKTETHERTVITLKLTALDKPYVKHDDLDDTLLDRYKQVVQQGLSLGAYDGDQLVGIVIAEQESWNRSLWVWEFCVAETHRRRGIGKQLMEALADKAKEAGMRVIVCETQNYNVPAIEFYRKVGFEIEGIDLSYYSNRDMMEGEVAIFMKRKLES